MSVARNQKVPASFDPKQAQNHQDIERQFAVKAVLHAQTYWNILEKVKGSDLRLTKFDDEIHTHFNEEFPEFDITKPIDEESMKSKAGKEKWRKFMLKYEKRVEDYNFGTLMRNDAKLEYTETTTIFVQRMQFYAVEIARNRAGLNDWIQETVAKETAAKETAEGKKNGDAKDKAEDKVEDKAEDKSEATTDGKEAAEAEQDS